MKFLLFALLFVIYVQSSSQIILPTPDILAFAGELTKFGSCFAARQFRDSDLVKCADGVSLASCICGQQGLVSQQLNQNFASCLDEQTSLFRGLVLKFGIDVASIGLPGLCGAIKVPQP